MSMNTTHIRNQEAKLPGHKCTIKTMWLGLELRAVLMALPGVLCVCSRMCKSIGLFEMRSPTVIQSSAKTFTCLCFPPQHSFQVHTWCLMGCAFVYMGSGPTLAGRSWKQECGEFKASLGIPRPYLRPLPSSR